MIKVYIISGFLGSGKTTLIKKLLDEHQFEKTMLIENEFGDINIDAECFDASITVKKIQNGCICCDLKGDLDKALDEVANYDVEHLFIEPSGIAKLSQITSAITRRDDMRMVSHVCMVDVNKAENYHKNYKQYYDDQIIMANAIILSNTDRCTQDKILQVKKLINDLNDEAIVVCEDYRKIDHDILIDIICDGACHCEECDGCMDIDELLHIHHDHHDHSNHHEHHHDFESISLRLGYKLSHEELLKKLSKIQDKVIRAKGYIEDGEGQWWHFDIADDIDVRKCSKKDVSAIVMIAKHIDSELKEVFE